LKPEFFQTPADFKTWLEKNHATATELWVGFYKKDSGKPSITWPESVDQALCVGWIDGIRKGVDQSSYQIRFTPRRRGSIWSAINIKRAKELVRQKQMRPTGLKAFAARIENKSGIYSYEQRSTELKQPYAKLLKKNKAASNFFKKQPPSYRKMIRWWIICAKKEETRMARLAKLISESAKGNTCFNSSTFVEEQRSYNRPDTVLISSARMSVLNPNERTLWARVMRRIRRDVICTSETWQVMPTTKEK